MARPRSYRPRKIPVTITFDPVVLEQLKVLAREAGRTVPSLVNSLAANQLLLLGRLAYELDDGEEAPECNIRFNQRVNAKGRVEIMRRANDQSTSEHSPGRSEKIPNSVNLPGLQPSTGLSPGDASSARPRSQRVIL